MKGDNRGTSVSFPDLESFADALSHIIKGASAADRARAIDIGADLLGDLLARTAEADVSGEQDNEQ